MNRIDKILSSLVILATVLSVATWATAAEEAGQVKEADWCTVRTPAVGRAGEKVDIEVTIKAGVITEDSTLNVDLHKFVGKKRTPGAGKARPVKIKANEASTHTLTLSIPKDANAVAFVVYVLPEGKKAWSDKTHATDVGMKVEAGADAPPAAPAGEQTPPPAPEKAPIAPAAEKAPIAPSAQPAGGVSRLFILSGQSNMVGFDPRSTFVPALEASFAGDTIVVVKDAENGQPIKRWYKNGTHDLYQRLMKEVKPAMEGREFASITFIWMQGESDAMPEVSGLYEQNMTGLIAQLRKDLNHPDLSVVIGRISDHKKGDADWDVVRAAQVKVADSDPLAGWVQTDELNGDDNNMHYRDKERRNELGRRFAAKAIELVTKSQD